MKHTNKMGIKNLEDKIGKPSKEMDDFERKTRRCEDWIEKYFARYLDDIFQPFYTLLSKFRRQNFTYKKFM